MVEFKYAPMFQLGPDETEYYKLTGEYVSVGEFEGKPILRVDPEGLTLLANVAFRDVNFLLRPAHNRQVAEILSDPDASDNDKYVALRFLRNAEVSAKGKLPLQDTGTATSAERASNHCFDDGNSPRVCSDLHRRVFATARTPADDVPRG